MPTQPNLPATSKKALAIPNQSPAYPLKFSPEFFMQMMSENEQAIPGSLYCTMGYKLDPRGSSFYAIEQSVNLFPSGHTKSRDVLYIPSNIAFPSLTSRFQSAGRIVLLVNLSCTLDLDSFSPHHVWIDINLSNSDFIK